jgi:hypothetical protein
VLGCGNSDLSAQLYDAGFKNITNVDYSAVVIEKMKQVVVSPRLSQSCAQLHQQKRPDMTWLELDAKDLKGLSDGSFDLVLDKGWSILLL